MLRVGLTGGIASGKSRVRRRFAAAGFETMDLDELAHEVTAPGGPAYEEVVAAFGPAILGPDRVVDRRALGARVFGDPEARARLNAIVHPRVREEEMRRVASHAARRGAVVVTDAALLVEVGMHLRFDRLVVAHCPPEEQVRRIVARDALDEAAARARVDAQMPGDLKRRFAHYAIGTAGTVEDTDAAADRVARELSAVASGRPGHLRVEEDAALGAFVHGPAHGPRGLDPAGVLVAIADAGALEMDRLQSRLLPKATGPWWEAASDGLPAPPGPESLAVPVVIWALTRVGPDAPFVAAAMASLARLTHRAPEAIAGACQVALAVQAVAQTRRVAWGDPDLRVWGAIGERWGGAPPPARIQAALEAAAAHPRDPAAAAAAASAAGADPGVAGALVGLAVGAPREEASADVLAALDALSRLS